MVGNKPTVARYVEVLAGIFLQKRNVDEARKHQLRGYSNEGSDVEMGNAIDNETVIFEDAFFALDPRGSLTGFGF